MPNNIYLVENTVNFKIYIGKTINSVERRWGNHVSAALRGSPFYFHNAIRKYGADAFEISILETVDDPGVLNEREIHWIATLHPDYNMTPGGDGFIAGHKHSAEHRQKLSDANRGRKLSAESKQKISDALRRRPPISDATRQKLRDAAKRRWSKRGAGFCCQDFQRLR
jgi:group I intron endonuclease